MLTRSPVITENAVMPNATTPFFDVETLRETSNTGMEHFAASIEGSLPADVTLERITEFAILDNNLNELCKAKGADLVVMGITGTSKIEEVLIGSTALSVVKNTTVPVIIVPAKVKNTAIKNVMFACDTEESDRNYARTTDKRDFRCHKSYPACGKRI